MYAHSGVKSEKKNAIWKSKFSIKKVLKNKCFLYYNKFFYNEAITKAE